MDAAVAADVVAVADSVFTESYLCGAVSHSDVDLSDISKASVNHEKLEITDKVNLLPIPETSNSPHCKFYGSYIFQNTHIHNTISILLGSIDNSQEFAVKVNIYTSETSNYHKIQYGLPQYDIYPLESTLN